MTPFDAGSVPPGETESVGTLLVRIQQAVRDRDEGAQARRFYRLEGAVHVFNPLIRRYGFDVDDVRQELLLRLFRWVLKHPDRVLTEPDAYARAIATHRLNDLAEKRKVEKIALDDGAAAVNFEDSGLHAVRDLVAAAELESRLIDLKSRFAEYLEQYAVLARTLGGTETARQTIRCWALRGVQKLPVAEVAARLGIADRAEGGAQTVWKWTERGREQVLKIAAWDEQHDPERARVMRDAALGVE